MKRECTLVQGKCNKMVTSAMPPLHHSKSKNSKNSINFLSQLQYKLNLCDFICDYIYVTLPIHSLAEVKIVTSYLQQSVSCDGFGKRPPNFGPRAKSGPRRRFVNNEKFFTTNVLIG